MNDESRSAEPSVEEMASKLKGKTLTVYWFLLRNPKPTSLREIQSGTGLSSPSLVSYHLKKLKDLDLISEDRYGQFALKKDVKVGILRFFVGSGRLLVPRYQFYAVFYSTLLIFGLFFGVFTLAPVSILLLIVLCFGTVTSWIETIRAWRIKI